MATRRVSEDAEIQTMVEGLARDARAAARTLGSVDAETKNRALLAAARRMREATEAIMAANAKDLATIDRDQVNAAFADRLELNPDRIEAMASGVEQIAALDDPVGDVMAEWDRPNGLSISRVRVPLGVIGIIYESRPNVTADAGALCLKSGNAAILRGGSESFHSSQAIHACLVDGLNAAGLPADAIQLIATRDRAFVGWGIRVRCRDRRSLFARCAARGGSHSHPPRRERAVARRARRVPLVVLCGFSRALCGKSFREALSRSKSPPTR